MQRSSRWRAAAGLCAVVQVAEAAPHPNSSRAKIFVYRLPSCSFDHYPPEDIDGNIWNLHDGRPPMLPIHRRIVSSRYVTDDPDSATLFYVPSPFFIWDSSWAQLERRAVCAEPERAHAPGLAFDGSTVLPLPPAPAEAAATSSSSGQVANAWTVSLFARIRASGEAGGGGRQVLLSAKRGGRCGLGFVGGCPALWGCGASGRRSARRDVRTVVAERCGRRPDSSLADGRWHAVAATYDGAKLKLYVDGVALGEATAELAVPGGWAYYGGSPDRGWPRWANFTGEARDLRLYRTAFHQDKVVRCTTAQWRSDDEGYDLPEALTPASPCFRAVRAYVEAQPWLHRRGGWDHFALFAGADYPRAFNPIHAPQEENFVLEHAWPAFSRFSILTFGARVERCFAWHSQVPAGYLEGAKRMPECVRRLFRSITIPPLLEGEPFDCERLESLVHVKRRTRVAYRGLAYSAMPERNAFKSLGGEFWIDALRETQEARLEFTNFTHERVDAGYCSHAAAFEGLCPWKTIGADPAGSFGVRRAKAMKQWSLGLWAKSDSCLVLPGDGGYELRLYSMVNLGCIPVIVHLAGTNFPKIPFSALLPWNEFAIFWALGRSGQEDAQLSYEQLVLNSAHALILQLASLGLDALRGKREALLRSAPALRWAEDTACGRGAGGGSGPSTMDLIVDELTHRASLPEDPARWTLEDWERKVPAQAIQTSMFEDLSGNGCPLGFPMCSLAAKREDPDRGDICYSATLNMGFNCPLGCFRTVQGGNGCIAWDGSPCRSPLCSMPLRLPLAFGFLLNSKEVQRAAIGQASSEAGWVAQGARSHLWDWEPRLALVTSGARPAFAALTRPSVERFLAAHPGRYEAFLGEQPVLDERDFADSWNKLALLRRTLLMGEYDAVVWLDDDVLITHPEADPIYDEIFSRLFYPGCPAQLLLSVPEPSDPRVPFSTGVLVLKSGVQALRLIEDLFRLGRRRFRLGGRRVQLRREGLFEEDALAVYVHKHGQGLLAGSPHGVMQSGVGPERATWKPGDFAAHFSSDHGEQRGLQLLRDFVRQRESGSATAAA